MVELFIPIPNEQYMNCPPNGNESGLLGYWNFEEGIGTTATDLQPMETTALSMEQHGVRLRLNKFVWDVPP